MFMTAWELWNARNEMFWEARVFPISEICQPAAIDFLDSVSRERVSEKMLSLLILIQEHKTNEVLRN